MTTKRTHFVVIVVIGGITLAMSTSSTLAQWQEPLVVGYYPDYAPGRLPIADIRYEKLTHIIYFSLSPNANGTLDTSNVNLSDLQSMVSLAHAKDVKVSISVGGWGRSDYFSVMAGNAAARASFVTNLTQYCVDKNLDGADLDWEPVSSGDRNKYTTLIQELKGSLSSHGLSLSVALAAWGSEINPSAISSIDWINIMAYDMGTPHSTFADAVSALNHWESFGFSRQKEVLGVPFYGKNAAGNAWYTYKEIIDTYHPGPDIDLIDLPGPNNDINFNGINTIKQKTEYAINSGYGGIMIWEISQDAFDETSLLTAITDAILYLTPPDFDGDGNIDLTDLAFFAEKWLSSDCSSQNDWCDHTDLDQTGQVDLMDFAGFAQQYLQ